MYEYNEGNTAPYHENLNKDQKPRCIVCGKALGRNPYQVEVVDGGKLREQDGSPADTHHEGYMGWWEVGSTCANKFSPKVLVRV